MRYSICVTQFCVFVGIRNREFKQGHQSEEAFVTRTENQERDGTFINVFIMVI